MGQRKHCHGDGSAGGGEMSYANGTALSRRGGGRMHGKLYDEPSQYTQVPAQIAQKIMAAQPRPVSDDHS